MPENDFSLFCFCSLVLKTQQREKVTNKTLAQNGERVVSVQQPQSHGWPQPSPGSHPLGHLLSLHTGWSPCQV